MMWNTDDVTALLEAFGQVLHAEDASRNTVSAYRADLHHFLTWLAQTMGTCRLDEITPTDIREYREFLQAQTPPAAPATINRRLAALRRFFVWAKEQQLTEVQPAAPIRNVESTEHGPKSLDRKQWNRLQRCIERATGKQGIRDRCIVLLLYHTGVRAGELAALRLDDLTLGERSGQFNVRRGKGNKARCVPLNAEARAAIRDYMQIRPTSEVQHFLVGQRGEPLSAHAIYDVVVKYARLAGLDGVSPHTLRHTFARALSEPHLSEPMHCSPLSLLISGLSLQLFFALMSDICTKDNLVPIEVYGRTTMTESESPVEVKIILNIEDDDVGMFLTQAIMISVYLPQYEIKARKMIGLHKALDLHEPLRTIMDFHK